MLCMKCRNRCIDRSIEIDSCRRYRIENRHHGRHAFMDCTKGSSNAFPQAPTKTCAALRELCNAPQRCRKRCSVSLSTTKSPCDVWFRRHQAHVHAFSSSDEASFLLWHYQVNAFSLLRNRCRSTVSDETRRRRQLDRNRFASGTHSLRRTSPFLLENAPIESFA